jgi:hypothetical protein
LTCNIGLLGGVGKWALISIRHPQIPRPWNPITDIEQVLKEKKLFILR